MKLRNLLYRPPDEVGTINDQSQVYDYLKDISPNIDVAVSREPLETNGKQPEERNRRGVKSSREAIETAEEMLGELSYGEFDSIVELDGVYKVWEDGYSNPIMSNLFGTNRLEVTKEIEVRQQSVLRYRVNFS